MTVLYFLGIGAIVVFILMLIGWINNISQRKFHYEFFSMGNLIATGIAYFLIYFGNNWYMKELAKNGDLLNGQLLIWIGVGIILSMLFIHIKNTTFLFGLIIGIFQLLIYIPATIIGGFILLVMMAWLSETRPVYRIN